MHLAKSIKAKQAKRSQGEAKPRQSEAESSKSKFFLKPTEKMQMSIASELEALKRSNGLIVVEDAERWARANTQSALYHALEWDDESAAQQFRFWQIRQLIAIHVINEVGQRQLISLSVDRVNRDGGGYRGVQDVLSVPNLRAIMLQDALTELERVQKKYDGIVELARVWEEAETVRRRSRRRGRRAA